MKVARKLWTWALALVATFAVVLGLSTVAMAAAGDTPPHTKDITDHQDGTYTISLDIVGESEKKPNNVNVIVIMDTSGSMNAQRMNAAKNAVNSLANSLYAYNTTENPDTVEMALVRFSTTESIAQGPTNSATTFRNAVNGLPNTGEGGTNWEGALQIANTVNFNDDDQTFVIFVSDGNPTFRYTEGNYPNHYNDYNADYYRDYGVWGSGSDSGYGSGTTIARCYEHAVDDAIVLANKVTPANFFTIGAFGNVDRMESLTDDAGSDSSTNYYSAQDTAALNQAIADILAKIEVAGFADAEIDDGTTSQVTTTSGEVANLLVVDESSYKYYRSGGSYGSMQQWADAPKAHLVNGTVEWDLSEVGVLENGVRYTVTFDCYPSQTTYDIIAQLKNGDIKYSELDSEIQKYIVDNGNGSYSLRTNTNAGIAWDDTRDDAGRQTSAYKNPDPVKTESSTLTATKEWEGGEPDVDSLEITVLMDDKPFHSATISSDNGWSTSSFISPGIIKGGQVLPGAPGHDFKFAELGDEQYHWELESPVVHPMLIDGTLTMLIKVDKTHEAPSGADTYTINGNTYYVDTAAAGLTAVNHRRSNLNLTKVVTGEDAPKDATFPFTLTVKNSKAPATAPEDDPEHNSDYWVWFSIYDTKAGAPVMDATVSGATGPNADGYYYAPSNSDITVQMKDGWNLRFTNLPSGTTYTFAEGTLPEGFAFNKAELTQGEDSTFKGAQTTTGTIENTKTSYTVKYTNDYALTDLEITKVWSDANNQDGIRLTAAQLADKLTLSPAVQGKTPAVTDNGDGTYTITYTGLPRFNNGEEVEYTVAESAIDGYTTTGSPAKDHGTITNTHTPETTTVKVTKVWDDSNDAGKIRPTSVSVQLTADGVASGDPVTLNEDNGWTHTWSDLPKYKNGTAIVYAADETEVPTGYTKTVTGDAATGITITNKYTPTPTTASFPVKKTISVPDGLTGPTTWSYTINVTANNGAPEAETMSGTVSNTTDTVTFGDFTFTMPGTYTYTVSESGDVAGVTNDTDADGKTVTVTVVDNGDGTLTATVAPTTGITFTNTYSVEPTTASISAEKVLEVPEGMEGPAEWSYDITATAQGDAPVASVMSGSVNQDSESITFGPITYTKPGTYTYNVSESGTVAGVTNDSETTKTVTVEVIDNGDGTLTATASPETGVVFTNTYNASGEATIEVTKAVTGAAWPAGKSLTLTLSGDDPMPETTTATLTAAGKATFGPITYSAPGEYTYTISEDGFGAGWTGSGDITAKVTVTDKGEGKLETSVSYSPSATITNTYASSGTVTLEATKALEGREWADNDEYTFTLYDKAGAVVDTQTVNSDNKKVTFKTISYTQDDVANSPITYTISETIDTEKTPNVTNTSGNITVSVALTDDGEGHITATPTYSNNGTITNTYTPDPTKAKITVTKTIDDYIPGSDKEFTFEMTPIEGAPMPEGKDTITASITTENGTGNVELDEITYTAAGEYKYKVVETGTPTAGWTYGVDETKEYTVTVNVTDDPTTGDLSATVSYGEGKTSVDVHNLFEEEGTEVTLHVDKKIDDQSGSAEDATFTFVLTPGEGAPGEAQTITVTTKDLEGGADFAPIEFTESGTFNYTIQETGTAPSGWTYDTKEYPVVITITDDFEDAILNSETTIDGEAATSLTITNVYKAAETTSTLEVTKEIDDKSGSAPDDVTFTFTLATTDDSPMPDPATTSVTGAGKATFGEITYDHVGEYHYTITETNDAGAGWTYDTTSYPVVVTVSDNNGELAASVAYGDSTSLTITNTYEPKPATAAPKALKTIDDQSNSATDETFTFQLIDPDGKVVEEKSRENGGPIDFSAISFTKIGTFKYTIKEVAGSTKGYTYDTADHSVTIKVEDKGDGNLEATITYADGEKATIKNVYKAEPVEVKLEGVKVLEGGKKLEAGEFTFELTGPDDEKIEGTFTNDADGNIDFGSYTFEKAGTYTYTATEAKGDNEHMTYDSGDHTFVITVTDEGGTLKAEVKSDDGAKAKFTNTYTPEPVSIDPPVQKVITGDKPASPATFTFQMKAITEGAPMPAESGNGIKTMQITGAGSKEFGEIVYTEPGEWVYEISELKGNAEGYTYDTTVYTLTVKVTQNDDGTLTKTETIKGGDAIVFTNKYEAPKIPKTGDVTPMISEIAGIAALGSGLIAAGALRRRRED